jgi:flagellar hook-basal body complex protein FliE
MANPIAAAGAYAATQRLAAPGGAPPVASLGTVGGQPSFSETLQQLVSSVAESGRNSDAQAAAAASGKGDMVNMVTAIAETETALQTLVAVRDRVIQSYEDIMRMPV